MVTDASAPTLLIKKSEEKQGKNRIGDFGGIIGGITHYYPTGLDRQSGINCG